MHKILKVYLIKEGRKKVVDKFQSFLKACNVLYKWGRKKLSGIKWITYLVWHIVKEIKDINFWKTNKDA